MFPNHFVEHLELNFVDKVGCNLSIFQAEEEGGPYHEQKEKCNGKSKSKGEGMGKADKGKQGKPAELVDPAALVNPGRTLVGETSLFLAASSGLK